MLPREVVESLCLEGVQEMCVALRDTVSRHGGDESVVGLDDLRILIIL